MQQSVSMEELRQPTLEQLKSSINKIRFSLGSFKAHYKIQPITDPKWQEFSPRKQIPNSSSQHRRLVVRIEPLLLHCHLLQKNITIQHFDHCQAKAEQSLLSQWLLHLAWLSTCWHSCWKCTHHLGDLSLGSSPGLSFYVIPFHESYATTLNPHTTLAFEDYWCKKA